jgi:multicomponent Na+:H+ antiporter subunit F
MFLLAAAGFVLLTTGIGLVSILRRPRGVDLLMPAQLLGTGGIAVLLLLAAGTHLPGVLDVCLVLALLAACVSAAFVKAWGAR